MALVRSPRLAEIVAGRREFNDSQKAARMKFIQVFDLVRQQTLNLPTTSGCLSTTNAPPNPHHTRQPRLP
jgi:hypothetical protein